ncbi:MAG: hypothetical protein JJV97_00310 [SAR324 cluster bacterium]|nr:hypothetical protein [SAR324 cluster bacterium]
MKITPLKLRKVRFLIVGFLFIIGLIFIISGASQLSAQPTINKRSALTRASVFAGYAPQVEIGNSSEFYKAGKSYGVIGGIHSGKLLGIGASYFNIAFADKLDSSIVFKSQIRFIDFFLHIPVPDILEVIVGVGTGQFSFDCFSAKCQSLYKNIKIKNKSSTASHQFIIMGLVIGAIYNVQFGYHSINTATIELSDNSFAQNREIKTQANAFSAGLEILF